jgi:hypothetical protein
MLGCMASLTFMGSGEGCAVPTGDRPQTSRVDCHGGGNGATGKVVSVYWLIDAALP